MFLARERIDQRIDGAIEDLIELMEREIHAMIGDARLWKVIGADALGTVAGTDHRFALRGDFRFLLGVGFVEQPRAQNFQCPRFVLVLRFFIATDNHHPARDMRDANGRVRSVDALAAGTRRAHHIDAKIFLFIDIDFDLVGLGHDGDGDGGGVDSSRRFGFGNPLHAMNSAFDT